MNTGTYSPQQSLKRLSPHRHLLLIWKTREKAYVLHGFPHLSPISLQLPGAILCAGAGEDGNTIVFAAGPPIQREGEWSAPHPGRWERRAPRRSRSGRHRQPGRKGHHLWQMSRREPTAGCPASAAAAGSARLLLCWGLLLSCPGVSVCYAGVSRPHRVPVRWALFLQRGREKRHSGRDLGKVYPATARAPSP